MWTHILGGDITQLTTVGMGAYLPSLAIVPILLPNRLDLGWQPLSQNGSCLSRGYSLTGRPWKGDPETLSCSELGSKAPILSGLQSLPTLCNVIS